MLQVKNTNINSKTPKIHIDSNITIIKKEIKSTFNKLKFNEKLHKYTYNDIPLTSTTTFLKQFYEEFDELKYSDLLKVSTNRKRKIKGSISLQRNKEFYLNRWEAINEEAKIRGHRVHTYAETNYPDFLDPPYCEQEVGVIDFFKDLPDNYIVLFLELRMHLVKYKKAGTSDIILYNKDTGNIVIGDYKTNQKSLLTYYDNSFFLHPFIYLKDHELNKYSLQLSDYQNMIELNTKYKVEERWIIHLSSKDYTQLDISKRNKSGYLIDLDNSPVHESKYYKIYKTKDYSKELLSCYK